MASSPNTYSRHDIMNAYRALGLESGDVVYGISAMWQMVGYEDGNDKAVEAHACALLEIIGGKGTLVVSTATMNLCNTDIPFDPAVTKSFNCGALSEHVRTLPGARRSLHPFGSYAAVGAQAAAICDHVSRHMYGPESPEARMIALGAKQVNIGLPPNINTTAHHIEHIMAVPYRYTKEFLHPVVLRDGETVMEPFYMLVRRLDTDVERDHCKRLFKRLDGDIAVKSARLGHGRVCGYSLAEFVEKACRIFADDIYIWCKEPPRERPFRQ